MAFTPLSKIIPILGKGMVIDINATVGDSKDTEE